MIIDCIGCLHGSLPKLDGGDLLIVTGDLTASDKPFQFIQFLLWLDKQKYSKKIFIGGNHDNILVDIPPVPDSLPENTQYLCDSGTEFEYWVTPNPPMKNCELRKLKIWGSPWSKTFKGINPRCKAFTVDTEEELAEKWKLIPSGTNILVTHTPPFGVQDGIPIEDGSLFHVGSHSLYERFIDTETPLLHIFSHIHEGYGKYQDEDTVSVNCSIMNARYKAVNAPIRVIL